MAEREARRFGLAWLLLSLALGLHATDEALTDFLSFYNPMVESLRERFGWWPMPTFTFERWITGLTVVVILLLVLSRVAYAGKRWLLPLAFFYGALMVLNGLGHMLGSVYFGRLLPGFFSSPLLLAAGVNLLYPSAHLSASPRN